jgi:HD superfamily phosphohydrolase
MISKAIEHAMAEGLQERELCELTDDALIYHLRQRYGGDRALRELVDALTARQLYKRCYMLSRRVGEEAVREMVRNYHLNEGNSRGEAEQRIAHELKAEPHEVAIYCAPEEMALKEAEMPVILGGGERARLSELNSAEIQVLKDKHRWLWRFYAFVSRRLAQHLEKAGAACEKAVGLPNELPAEMRGRL